MAVVGLVAVGRGVKAGVGGLPAVVLAQPFLGDAVALVRHALGMVGRVAVDEVVVPVLLAGEVGAPGGDAHGAVVEGADHLPPAGVGGGLHERVAGQRAAELHGGEGGDAAVVARAGDPLPVAAAVLLHLDDADAVGGLLLLHVLHLALAIDVDDAGGVQGGVDVLVVDHQQAVVVGRLRKGEEVHAVVVVAGLLELVFPGFAGVALEGRGIGEHGIAPGEERPGAVALGDDDLVEFRIELLGHALEAQQRGLGQGAAGADAAAEEAQGREGQAALEDVAAAGIDHLVQGAVAAGVDGHVVMGGQCGVESVVVPVHHVSLLVMRRRCVLSVRCGSGRCCARRARLRAGRFRGAAGSEKSALRPVTGG